MRRTILAVAVLALLVSAPAYAADYYTGILYAPSDAHHHCIAVNKGTGNITVTVEIFQPFTGPLSTCGPSIIGPNESVNCNTVAGDSVAICHVKTNSGGNTRSVFQIVGANGVFHEPSANLVPR